MQAAAELTGLGIALKKEPSLLERRSALPYRQQVKQWGSHLPWGKRGHPDGFIQLKHRTTFDPSDVKTDARGDIVDMPFLDGKACFARPETFLRHGHGTRTYRDPYRGDVLTKKHQCARCRVRDACRDVVSRRLKAHPPALAAFTAWRNEVIRVLGQAGFDKCFGRNHTIYTGRTGERFGYLWQDFLAALGAIGPFTSSNDDELERRREAKLQKKRESRRRKMQKWRDGRREEKLPPDPLFEADAKKTRDLRKELLDQAAASANPDDPLWRLDDRGRSITADAWFEKTMLEQAGMKPTAGKIAKRLLASGRVTGITEEALRNRLYRDLERVGELEDQDRIGGPIWPPFDPLASAEDDERLDQF